ncbi:MAG: uncharacterized protein KVP18_000610 [Porospora cf. gigantea A]|uniref:uncharacterized protein n=1 Tax=Porospora cf. gigantea A TaxID=2853593 RepID=UPI003559660E|nr:MAG: hypothetical protein KVP18_000610 [Porospora cf. gigantea A]
MREEKLFPIAHAEMLASPTATGPANPDPTSSSSSVCDLRNSRHLPVTAKPPCSMLLSRVQLALEDAKGIFIRVISVECQRMKPHKRYPITLKWGDTGDLKTITLPSAQDQTTATVDGNRLSEAQAALPFQHRRRLLVKVMTEPGCCRGAQQIGMARVDLRPFAMDIENCNRPTLFQCTLTDSSDNECGLISLEANFVLSPEDAGANFFEVQD